MNYLVLSKLYKIINCKNECENNREIILKVQNYKELENYLIDYNYDFIPEEILMDVKIGNIIEEALAKPNSLTLTSDNTKISYSKTQFLIKWFCNNEALIEVKDDKKYCKKCFENKNKELSFEKIKKILDLKNETYGLSTSKKIEYILVKNQEKKLSMGQIYEIGKPWDLKTFTPRNSVYARISSLFKVGSIKRDGVLYFI